MNNNNNAQTAFNFLPSMSLSTMAYPWIFSVVFKDDRSTVQMFLPGGALQKILWRKWRSSSVSGLSSGKDNVIFSVVRASSNYKVVSKKLKIWLQSRREVAKKISRNRGSLKRFELILPKNFTEDARMLQLISFIPSIWNFQSLSTTVSILTN